jgi:hypothetical protein
MRHFFRRMLTKYIANSLINSNGTEHNSMVHHLYNHSIVSQCFMEPKGPLPHSQELCTCPYQESDQSSPHHPILSFENPS